MKKPILSLFALALVAVSVDAAPRFGIIAEQNSGVGLFVTDSVFNAQITGKYGTAGGGKVTPVDTTVEVPAPTTEQDFVSGSITSINLGANYKIGVSASTALTVGLNGGLNMVKDVLVNNFDETLKANQDDDKTELGLWYRVGGSVGVEQALSSNVVLTVQTDVVSYEAYTLNKDAAGTEYTDTTKTKKEDTKRSRLTVADNTRVGVAFLF